MNLSGKRKGHPEAAYNCENYIGDNVTDYMLYKAIALLILAFVWNFIYAFFIEKSPPPVQFDTLPDQEDRAGP